MARNEATGQERFMPRSALVETDGEALPAPAMPAHNLAAAEVQRAWQQFHERWAVSIASVAGRVDPELHQRLERELAATSNDFERTLGLHGGK
jgi:hypothetical protein